MSLEVADQISPGSPQALFSSEITGTCVAPHVNDIWVGIHWPMGEGLANRKQMYVRILKGGLL